MGDSLDLAEHYRAYLDCLNRQDWKDLWRYVADDVQHNGRPLGLSGYRDMLVKDHADIPDLRFNAEILVCDASRVAARLMFDCHPKGQFMGQQVNGRRVKFAENVFYEFEGEKISYVWSVIDKAAVEAQLKGYRQT